MSIKIRKQDALDYHTKGQPGKIEVTPTKELSTQLDLALAYSPGVAEPCKEIAANREDVYKYTSKGNLVAVITNGTAVLGLGNIGPEAAKPVMEGKAVLFKKYAGIDSFDIEINEEDPDKFIEIVKSLEPTFGGINLEDIKAPECFKIETVLREKMNIPIMHDDQHGTAIISSAALLNALLVAKKKIDKIVLVVNGAGAAAVTCTKLYLALANPNLEIDYDLAKKTRLDIIMGTGRSDFPNQINNVLGFPYIFRGALDVRATEINEAMKLAAVHALADLAKEPVPDSVFQAYDVDKIEFGRDYLIPKPLDPRLITTVSPAVAKAAMDSGMATNPIKDWGVYNNELLKRIGIDQKLTSQIIEHAKKKPKRILFAEADTLKILKAAQILQDEKIAIPILLGSKIEIDRLVKEHNLDISECKIVDPREEKELTEKFAKAFYKKRERKGINYQDALRQMRDRSTFGAMMLEFGEADALVSGLTKDYSKTILPSLQIIGMAPNVSRVAGMDIIINKKGTFFFSDCTVNVDPTVDELVGIIELTTRGVKFFDKEPRVAVLSYSNFGSSNGEIPEKTRKPVRIAKQKYPDLIFDGENEANA